MVLFHLSYLKELLRRGMLVPVSKWETWLQEVINHGSNLSSLKHTASIPVSKWETWLHEKTISGIKLRSLKQTASISVSKWGAWLNTTKHNWQQPEYSKHASERQQDSVKQGKIIFSIQGSSSVPVSEWVSLTKTWPQKESILAKSNWTRSILDQNPPTGSTSGIKMGHRKVGSGEYLYLVCIIKQYYALDIVDVVAQRMW